MGTFYGSGPGQDLAEVVDRLSADELYTVLGEDVVSLIEALADVEDRSAILRRIATEMLRDRANDLMARSDIRETCFNAILPEKRIELADRLGVTDVETLRTMDPTQDARTWQAFLGFFGIDARGAAPFAIDPQQEVVRPEFGLFSASAAHSRSCL